MIDTAFYLVTKEIALRSGVIENRYRTADGMYVLDSKDLSRIRFTTDEYVNGLNGVQRISDEEARDLIARGGYSMGVVNEQSSTITPTQEVNNEEVEEETQSEEGEESIDEVKEESQEETPTEEEEESAKQEKQEEN